MEKLRRWFRYETFTQKIWLTILACFLILLTVVVAILMGPYRAGLLEQIEAQYAHEDEVRLQSVEYYTNTANSCVNTIIVHLNSALSGIDLVSGYPRQSTATQKKLYHCMLNTFNMFEGPVEIMVVWNNGTGFYQGQGYRMTAGERFLLEEMQSLPITRQGLWTTEIHSDTLIGGTGFYFIKPYTVIDTGERKGYVILKLSDLHTGWESEGISRSHYLFAQNGMLLQTTDKQILSRVQQVNSYEEKCAVSAQLYHHLLTCRDDEDYFFTEMTLDHQFSIISYIPKDQAASALIRTLNIIAVAVLFILLVTFGAVAVVTHRTLAPVRMLSNHMLDNPNDMPSLFRLRHGNDEIGVLIDSYNQMTKNNRDLFEQNLKAKQLQKQLEFSLLQAQIKPHFLYNSLDAIYCLNMIGRSKEAGRMTKLLSDYYRLSLSDGSEWIRLKDEVQMTRLYLEIQKVRYPKVLAYAVNWDEDVPDIRIPKLTLQPLVENAIYHGIKPSGIPGVVSVSVEQREGVIEIRVQDDGIGFPQELFDSIENGHTGMSDAYGLRNVMDRLRLYYAGSCRLMLEPKEKGTCILLKIRPNGEV